MKFFRKSGPSLAVFGAAMLALVGTTATTEQVDAANQELDAAGRIEMAEASAKCFTDALTAAGVESAAALVAQRDGYKVKADKFDKKSSASHITPVLPEGESDFEDSARRMLTRRLSTAWPTTRP